MANKNIVMIIIFYLIHALTVLVYLYFSGNEYDWVKDIDSTIEKTTEEIKLSEDLLKSLIEQVVTGKMKVPKTYNSKKDTISIAAEPVNTYNTP